MLKTLARAIKKRLKTIIFLIIVGSMYGFYQIKLEELIVDYSTIKYKEENIKITENRTTNSIVTASRVATMNCVYMYQQEQQP